MTNIIKIENAHSWLISDDDKLRARLHASLRVRPKNYWHSTAYKRKIWDGWVDFFNKKSGKFLTGLLPEVSAAMRVLNAPYTVDDTRKPQSWLQKTITADFLTPWTPQGEPPRSLYDYQMDYVHQAVKFGRGLITSPTGSGKTMILISLMKILPPKTPILFMAKGSSLVHQNYEEMLKWGLQDVGRYYGKFKEPNYITCCTIHPDTLKGIQKLLPKFKVLIVDEVHEAMSDVPVKAYLAMTSATHRYGFSATPFKFGGKDKEHKFKVKGHFGGVFKTTTTASGILTTKDLQERKILSKSKCTIYPINQPKNISHEPYQDAVTLGIANNIYLHNILKKLATTIKGRTIITVERIDQGNYLQQLLPTAHWISGKDSIDIRKDVFSDLRSEENVIAICMQQIITAGIDVFIHNLINAAGGKAEHSIVQRMGRGLRCAPDKAMLDYYDFLFTTNDYLQQHSLNRIQVLEEEGHEIIIKQEIDF
jgi:superfamily II DNA or RNA helicase